MHRRVVKVHFSTGARWEAGQLSARGTNREIAIRGRYRERHCKSYSIGRAVSRANPRNAINRSAMQLNDMAGQPQRGDKWEPGTRRRRINGEIFCFAIQIMASEVPSTARTLPFAHGPSIFQQRTINLPAHIRRIRHRAAFIAIPSRNDYKLILFRCGAVLFGIAFSSPGNQKYIRRSAELIKIAAQAPLKAAADITISDRAMMNTVLCIPHIHAVRVYMISQGYQPFFLSHNFIRQFAKLVQSRHAVAQGGEAIWRFFADGNVARFSFTPEGILAQTAGEEK